MFSIDQNSHSLWDVLPKLHALARGGRAVRHFVEDIDVAFTARGAAPGDAALRLARERFYRSGGSDWGAAMFYAEFLGRQPAEIRDWERWTGLKTDVLARRLGRSVDDLYDEFSPGGTWQVIGPSYVGDRDHHRVIGDLAVAEIRPLLEELLGVAEADMRRAFPQPVARDRLSAWFETERRRVRRLLDRCASAGLADLYHEWLAEYAEPTVALDRASALLACGADEARTALLEVFLRDYDLAAGLYNEAVAEADLGLHALDRRRGELPFFAVLTHQGHVVRTGAFLEGRTLRLGQREFPLGTDRRLPIDSLKSAGVRCLAGKAILLVIQVRVGPRGQPLALPYRGSLYLPAAMALERKLAAAGLLGGPVQPVVRVRFRLLDRLASLETIIRLPEHLREAFGRDELPARDLAANWRAVADAASARLSTFRTEQGRDAWLDAACPALREDLAQLDARRRTLAETDEKSPEIRQVWKRCKAIQVEMLDRLVRRIDRDVQAAALDYWDSRGALMPWCIALGGEAFYNTVADEADIYDEPSL